MARVRGNRGELAAVPLSSHLERYGELERVFLFGASLPPGGLPVEVERTWFHDRELIFKFRGVDTICAAEPLREAEVRLPIAERRPAEPGEYFHSDLIGCELIDARSGESLGLVTGFDESGGVGLLATGGGLLVPFARSICVSIDVTARRIVVDLPEGLKELNRT